MAYERVSVLFLDNELVLFRDYFPPPRAAKQYASTVQPKAGRSENIYFDAKVSKLHLPSSLGLDGDREFLPHHED